MSRSFPVWLLALVICTSIGCGGGDATDSPLVAEADNSSASSTAPMDMPAPSGNDGSESMEMSASSGMPGEIDASTYGAGGAGTEVAPGMDPADYAGMEAAGAEYAGTEADTAVGAMSPEDYATMAENAGADYEGAAMAEASEVTAGENYPGAAGAEGELPGGDYPGGEGGPGGVAEKLPEGFEGKAQHAFRRGKDRDAIQYLYAYALTTDAGAESVLPTIRWVAGLREPKLAVRWGVGFVVTAPRNFNGDPKPVGSKQNIPTRGGNRAAGGDGGYVGGGGEGDYGGGNGGAKNSLLSKGAGELGEKLAAAYTERLMRGDFGEVLKKAMEGGRGATQSGGEYAGAGGMGYEGGGAEMSSGPGGNAGGAAALTEVSNIMTGLSMLGIGTQKELIDRAREEDIDAVVIIDVKLRVNTSNGLVTNESTLAL
ncbi:MAG TPA: hypothetical protein P5307_13505, partial [Pirellulaceae bacterium]|nr:hypothetical protein [Pirellulaceae bacterium]